MPVDYWLQRTMHEPLWRTLTVCSRQRNSARSGDGFRTIVVRRQMMTGEFVGNYDRPLDFVEAKTGPSYFVPSHTFLEQIVTRTDYEHEAGSETIGRGGPLREFAVPVWSNKGMGAG
jgi:hypothetical protein